MLVTAPPSPAPSPARVPRLTGASAPRVSAVLVVRDGASWLPETLDALAGSTLLPDRLVVVDLAATDGPADLVRRHEGLRRAVPDTIVVEHEEPSTAGEAVALAVAALGPEDADAPEWLWLLRDDTAAEPSTLRRLVEAVRRSPSVGVAGPKTVQWENPRRLVEAGHQVTRSGRRIFAPEEGELDQGQYDARTDVLAVGAAGMLVRRRLFEALGGFDPAFSQAGGDLDFGWRAQLTGHRVLLVPGARIRAARAGGGGDAAARRTARRAARRVCLTRCPALTTSLLAAWMLVSALTAAVLLLVLKRPRAAWDELSDLAALLAPLRSAAARWRFRGKARLRHRDLATLFVRPGQALRHTVDGVHDALRPHGLAAPARTTLPVPAEPGPVADAAPLPSRLPASLPQRVVTNPGVLAVVAAAVVALVGMRETLRAGSLDLRGAGLAGGQLHSLTTNAAGLWQAYRDSWHGSGFGTGADPGPHLAVLAGLTGVAERLPFVAEGRSPASVTVTWLVVFGMPLATAAAYLAGRVVTRARTVRAAVALAWGTAGVAAAAAADGRVTVLLAHALLPLAAAGVARTAGPSGTYTSAFGAALALGVLGALVPILLVVGALAASVLLLVVPGWSARARSLVLLAVPVALQGPSLVTLRDPARLFGAPGLLAGPDQAAHPPWLLALAALDTVLTWQSLLAVPILAAGVLGLRSAGPRVRASTLTALGALAVLGLLFAVGASRLVVGGVVDPDGTVDAVTPWPGVGVQMLLLAVLAGALVGLPSRIPSGVRGRWLAAGGGLVAAAVLAGAASVALRGLDPALRVGGEAPPALATDQAQGPLASRLLALERVGQGVDFAVVGSEPGTVLRALPPGDRVSDPGLTAIVEQLAAAATGPVVRGERLADLGVGFLTVRAPTDDPLLRALDAAPGLTRLGSADGEIRWRVLARPSAAAATEAVPPSRVRVTTPDGAPLSAVPTVGPHGVVDHELAAGPAGRRVVVAEPVEWAARAQVRFDGAALAPLAGQPLPAYELPERAGHLRIGLPPVPQRWQAALAVFVVFMAIPLGNRRSRRLG